MSRLLFCGSACLALWACDVEHEVAATRAETALGRRELAPPSVHGERLSLSEEQVEILVMLERVVEKLGDLGASERLLESRRRGSAWRVIACLELPATSPSEIRTCLETLPEADLGAYLGSVNAVREELN